MTGQRFSRLPLTQKQLSLDTVWNTSSARIENSRPVVALRQSSAFHKKGKTIEERTSCASRKLRWIFDPAYETSSLHSVQTAKARFMHQSEILTRFLRPVAAAGPHIRKGKELLQQLLPVVAFLARQPFFPLRHQPSRSQNLSLKHRV